MRFKGLIRSGDVIVWRSFGPRIMYDVILDGAWLGFDGTLTLDEDNHFVEHVCETMKEHDDLEQLFLDEESRIWTIGPRR